VVPWLLRHKAGDIVLLTETDRDIDLDQFCVVVVLE